MIALRKRQRPRSGILRAPPREFPRHRKFVRSHDCILRSAPDHACNSFAQCCHYRTAANAGTGLKPPDWETWPGCDAAHKEQHAIGQPAFERKYGVDLAAIAAELARRSPDLKMKLVMSERGRG